VCALSTVGFIRFKAPSILINTTAGGANSTLAGRRLLAGSSVDLSTYIVNPHVASDLAIEFLNGFLLADSLVGQVYYSKDTCHLSCWCHPTV
jgi:hypothetical protein